MDLQRWLTKVALSVISQWRALRRLIIVQTEGSALLTLVYVRATIQTGICTDHPMATVNPEKEEIAGKFFIILYSAFGWKLHISILDQKAWQNNLSNISPSLSLSLSISISLSISLSYFLSLNPLLSLSPFLSISLPLSLSLPFSFSVSLSLSLTHKHTHTLEGYNLVHSFTMTSFDLFQLPFSL